MGEIMGGVRSMMTYIGAAHLKEVPKRTTFVRVSAQTNGIAAKRPIFGGACPSRLQPQPGKKSRSLRPSASQTHDPSPRTRQTG